jgi:hypothetical protein
MKTFEVQDFPTVIKRALQAFRQKTLNYPENCALAMTTVNSDLLTPMRLHRIR